MVAFGLRLGAAGLGALLAISGRRRRPSTPKRGGTLTYMIPADAPPTFDGHRETTFATGHTGAPFYSVLIRINPDNPGSTTDFVCDLCTEMPKPTDGGKTWTFKIRQGVKFHDGSPLTAADVAASLNKIAFPPEGVLSPRSSNFEMVDKIESHRPEHGRLSLEIRDHGVPAGARRPVCLDLQEGDPRQGPALVREEHHGFRPVQVRRLRDRAVDQGRAQPRLLPPGQALSRRDPRHLRAETVDPHRGDAQRPRRDGVPRHAAGLARRAEKGPRRQDHRAGKRLELRQRRDDRTMPRSRSTMPGSAAR